MDPTNFKFHWKTDTNQHSLVVRVFIVLGNKTLFRKSFYGDIVYSSMKRELPNIQILVSFLGACEWHPTLGCLCPPGLSCAPRTRNISEIKTRDSFDTGEKECKLTWLCRTAWVCTWYHFKCFGWVGSPAKKNNLLHLNNRALGCGSQKRCLNESKHNTRKSSCVNARGILPAAQQVHALLFWKWYPLYSSQVVGVPLPRLGWGLPPCQDESTPLSRSGRGHPPPIGKNGGGPRLGKMGETPPQVWTDRHSQV